MFTELSCDSLVRRDGWHLLAFHEDGQGGGMLPASRAAIGLAQWPLGGRTNESAHGAKSSSLETHRRPERANDAQGRFRTPANWLIGSFLLVQLAGCGLLTRNVPHKPTGFTVEQGAGSEPTPRKIAVFFDGTANDESSDTNVKRLHSLVSLQNRGDIASLYVAGVGDTVTDMVGMVTGAGFNARVRLGYEFILNHYQPARDGKPADEIYIFGFSRGAYTARILATMLHYGGLVEEASGGKCRTNQLAHKTAQEMAEVVHAAVFLPFMSGKEHPTSSKRLEDVSEKLNDECLQRTAFSSSLSVKVLGLWDTVEALGVVPIFRQRQLLIPTADGFPPKANVDIPNKRYGDSFCGVENIFHAVSIDDNRATVFTPLLASRKHLYKDCRSNHGPVDSEGNLKAGSVREVWFSGAHSDVGGGYANGALSGVSLNWMIEQLAEMNLLPAFTSKSDKPIKVVREDALGGSNNPRAGIFGVYPNVLRDIVGFALEGESIWGMPSDDPADNGKRLGVLCIHDSVRARRTMMDALWHENNQLLFTGLMGPRTTIDLAVGQDYGPDPIWKWTRQARAAGETALPNRKIEVQIFPKCDGQDAVTPLKDSK